MKVFVTGGTGLVGRELLRRLVERGDDVIALVRPFTLGDTERMAALPSRDQIRFVRGELPDDAPLQRAMKGVEIVYHLAGGVEFSGPAELAAATNAGTASVVRAAVARGAGRVVFTSSAAVYGYGHPPAQWPIREDAPLEGTTPYAQSKVAAECQLRLAAREHHIDYVVVRPSGIYSGSAPHIEALVTRVARNRIGALGHAGGTTTQPIDVRDVCDALLLAGANTGRLCRTLNVAGTRHVTQAALIRMIASALFPRIQHSSSQHKPLSVLRYDVGLAEQVLGFRPAVDLERTVSEAVADVMKERPDKHDRSVARHLGRPPGRRRLPPPRAPYAQQRRNGDSAAAVHRGEGQ